MCEVLGVSTSGYYDWRDRKPSQRQQENQRLTLKIRCFHQASRETYGSPRIHQDLLDNGESLSRQRVARLMRQAGIQAKTTKRIVLTTRSRTMAPPAPDALERNFSVLAKDRAWVSDTTFIRSRKGWLYLAVLLDLYSRRVVGWSISERNDKQLVMNALDMAITHRAPLRPVIVHSDRGATYTSCEYQQLLKSKRLIASMGRKGDCYDNAVAESFFGTLKTELVDDQDYFTHEQAKRSLFEYIELFYNRYRRHSYLNYRSPIEFEEAAVPLSGYP